MADPTREVMKPLESSHRVLAKLSKTHWLEAEGHVWLSVNDIPLKCFVDVRYVNGKDRIDARLGKEIEVIFSILSVRHGVTADHRKEIACLPVERGPKDYEIVGESIGKVPIRDRDSERVVIDCGFPIHLSVRPGRYEKGDWLRAVGRLDAHFPIATED